MKITPENATNQQVQWSSSDESIATIDRHGLITAVGTGTVTFTGVAQSVGLSTSITVTVNSGTFPNTGNDFPLSIYLGMILIAYGEAFLIGSKRLIN
jgi:uncharacterized protein YjdB